MKKILIILLMLVYGLSSTGTSVNLHFCCGKLDAISFTPPQKKSCEKKKEGFSKIRCCDNKHYQFQLRADQEPAVKWVQVQKVFAIALPQPQVPMVWQGLSAPVNILCIGPPSYTSAVPVFIKNCVFRI